MNVVALPARIASKIDLDTKGCWVWTAARLSDGYGRVGLDGKVRLAHRVVYEILVGPIPDGLDLDHLCRNRACVNPNHLEPVTPGENNRRGLHGYALRALCKSGRHNINDPANVYTNPGSGKRQCHPCNNESKRDSARRHRAADRIGDSAWAS